MALFKKILLFFASLLFFLILWEWSALTFPHLLFVFPPPSEIFVTLLEMHDRFWFHTCVTLKEMCAGFLLALICAFPLAWVMVQFETTRSVLQPFFIVIQCIPMFTLAPIMVVWFGWNYIAIVIPTALMIFFPLTLNIYQGLRSVPEDLIEFFQANQATSGQIFFKLRLPWAVPHIFAGFRISSAIAGVSAIAAEWAGAQNGLGILMLESRRNADLEITFGALFCLTLVSTILYGVIIYCEKIILPPRRWKFLSRGAAKNPLKKTKKSFVFPLGIILLIFTLSSCYQDGKTTNQIRLLLDWLPNPNHIPLYVGLEKGYFKEEGMDLCIQKMHEGGSGISYLVAKKADLLINHMPGTLKAQEKGANLKIVGLLIKEPLCGLIYRADPKIHQPSDLSGKVFGYCIGIPEIDFVYFLLKQGNIHPSIMKNVSVDLVSAMGTHNVDFIYGGFWNIEPPQLESLGVKTETFKIQDLGVPPYYEMIILAHADSPHATADFTLPFQRALQKSLDFCKECPEEAFSYFLKHNKDRRSKTIVWQKQAWALTHPLLAKDQIIENEVIKNFYHWQLTEKIISSPFDFQDLLPIQ